MIPEELEAIKGNIKVSLQLVDDDPPKKKNTHKEKEQENDQTSINHNYEEAIRRPHHS